jgi:hypothetical protein
MSKGPGRVERAILAAMQPLGAGDKAFTIPELADIVYGTAQRSAAGLLGDRHRVRMTAVRRAVHNLCRRHAGQLSFQRFRETNIAFDHRPPRRLTQPGHYLLLINLPAGAPIPLATLTAAKATVGY